MTLCCWRCLLTTDPTQRRNLQLKRERKRIHAEIEKDLQHDKKRRQKEHRILLLGCGEAGKSTFIKQMRIIHSSGFSREERLAIKRDIASNIVSAIQTLLFNISQSDEDSLSPELFEAAERVRALPDTRPEPHEVYHVVKYIKALWESKPIQDAYSRRNQFQMVECAKYFLSRVETVMDPDYEPVDNDIVQARVKTEGIIEHEFEISSKKGEMKKKLILIDVGGQRNERRKWIHCFEDVMLIIFLTAVSEYDQVLEEDESTNRIKESLRLFKTILEYHWFATTNVILFLNKNDLLQEKVQYSHVRTYFPEFRGPDRDALAAIEFFSEEFRFRNPNPDEREIFVQPTCATDTENIKLVDVAVQNTITKAILENVGLN